MGEVPLYPLSGFPLILQSLDPSIRISLRVRSMLERLSLLLPRSTPPPSLRMQIFDWTPSVKTRERGS